MPILPIAAALATAFNLVCTGETDTFRDLFSPKENAETITLTYRVDLSAGRWCVNACKTTDSIYQVNDTEIILSASEVASGSDEITKINRESGEWLSRARFLPLVVMTTGKCERADFTGFPGRKF